MNPKDLGFSTKSDHGGKKLYPLTGSVTTPIYQTSNFGFTDLDLLKGICRPLEGVFLYPVQQPHQA